MIAAISGVLRVMSRGYFELLIVSRGNVYQICLNDVLRALQFTLPWGCMINYANVWESMGKPCSCMQFIKTCNFTISHARIHISSTSLVRIRISSLQTITGLDYWNGLLWTTGLTFLALKIIFMAYNNTFLPVHVLYSMYMYYIAYTCII